MRWARMGDNCKAAGSRKVRWRFGQEGNAKLGKEQTASEKTRFPRACTFPEL